MGLPWLSRLSDVLPPLRSQVRTLYRTSDRTWEHSEHSAKSRGFSPGSPVSSAGKNLTGCVRINSYRKIIMRKSVYIVRTIGRLGT